MPLSISALVLPGAGNVFLLYVPPLIVAQLLGAFARDEPLSPRTLAPYVLGFAAAWTVGEAVRLRLARGSM